MGNIGIMTHYLFFMTAKDELTSKDDNKEIKTAYSVSYERFL